MAHEPTPAPLAVPWLSLENSPRHSPITLGCESLCGSQVSSTLEHEFGCIGEHKSYNCTLHHLPHPFAPLGDSIFLHQDLLGLTFPGWGKWEPVSVYMASAAVCDAAKEAHFCIQVTESLNEWLGWEEAGRVTDRIMEAGGGGRG